MGEGEGADCPPKNVQSDATTAATDVPAKKLARQLDFTGFSGATGTVGLPETVVPSQPQPRPLPQQSVVVMPVPPQPPLSSTRVG